MAVLLTPRVVPFRGTVPGPPRSYRVALECECSSVACFSGQGACWLNDFYLTNLISVC